MYIPSLQEIKEKISYQDYDLIPIKKEMYLDVITPIELMRKLKATSKHVFMLESNEDSTNWGRYTFIGYNPIKEITCNNYIIKDDGKEVIVENPQNYIRNILNECKSVKLDNFPPFTGGLVGYFAYDFFKYSEKTLDLKASHDDGFQDIDLMMFHDVICFDNYKQKIIIITNIQTNDLDNEYQKGVKRLDEIEKIILTPTESHIPHLHLLSDFQPMFDKESYCKMVEKGKRYIREGDIFQVVLSNRLEAKCSGSLFDTYRVLRTTNPSPYMFYFSSDTLEVAGASPETLVKKIGSHLTTFPIAGSRRRGKDEEEDKALVKDLLSDEKELAEHNMLVDLGRNDLGKISKFNSVKVEKYQDIVKFSKIMHIASQVGSELKDGYDALDVISSILPAGTLSGAPKIRACQIINELEDDKRGIYGGAIGYIDFTGNLDTCIGIRLAYKKDDKVYVRSGGGIVYDSVSENEHQECINKASAVINALEIANGGIDNDSINR